MSEIPIFKGSIFKFMASRSKKVLCLSGSIALACFSNLSSAQAPDFITFESGQVRPIALSRDGTKLFVCNTPDNRLEIFSVTEEGLTPQHSVPVGLEPVSIVESDQGDVWVVNHLSDSVSIVDADAAVPRVTKTLLVGDEPRDIVIAGNGRAFITTARRGQHRVDPSISGVPGAGDPLLTTPSVPRADVWVFDTANPGAAFGGTPLSIVELFTDTPRALTVSPDGSKVYAAGLFTGNQTAAVQESFVCEHEEETCVVDGQLIPGPIVGPKTNAAGERGPKTGMIVKFNRDNGRFEDQEGRDWTDVIKFTLPDRDVFEIDAQSLQETDSFNHVGTTIFNMVTNPVSGTIYVSNFEANNFGLFTGAGNFSGETVQGHLSESRITVIQDGQVLPRHLNKHIDYDILPAPPGTKENSLATPLQMQVSSDGSLLAVAAYGSNKIGIFSTEALEKDTFDPEVDSANYIQLSGGGPSGIVLDESRNVMFVLTRFDNTVSIVDLESGQESQRVAMFNPEPQSVVEGRVFLYDANLTSSNGEAACASCHIFGDLDQLAWNLGDPDGEVIVNPTEILLGFAAGLGGGDGGGGLFDGLLGGLVGGDDNEEEEEESSGGGFLGGLFGGGQSSGGGLLGGLFGGNDNEEEEEESSGGGFLGGLFGGGQSSGGGLLGGLLGGNNDSQEEEQVAEEDEGGLDLGNFSVENINGTGDVQDLHPNKGPMTTQTLKGMTNHGPLHWRGDRSNGFFGIDEAAEPPFDIELNFNNFIVAFTGLNGREEIIEPEDMQKFTDFTLQMVLPPNPIRALDNSLNRSEQRGREFYLGCAGDGFLICDDDDRPIIGAQRSDGVPLIPGVGFTCEGCHTLDPENGFFGTDGTTSFDVLFQTTKVTHIRNAYTKVGMFGNPSDAAIGNENQGDQIRGFGVFHDGGLDTIFRFMSGEQFDSNFDGRVGFVGGDPQRRDVEAFMLAFDQDLAPITGQQVTLASDSNSDVDERIDLLLQRASANFDSQILGANAKECDLVATAVINGIPRGFLFNPDANSFIPDSANEGSVSVNGVKGLAQTPGQEVTFTCVPFGSGERIALDRDRDGVLNADE